MPIAVPLNLIKANSPTLRDSDNTVNRLQGEIKTALTKMAATIDARISALAVSSAASALDYDAAIKIRSAAFLGIGTGQMSYFGESFAYDQSALWTSVGASFALSQGKGAEGGILNGAVGGAAHTGTANMKGDMFPLGWPTQNGCIHMKFAMSGSSPANTLAVIGLVDNLGTGTVFGVGTAGTATFQFMALTTAGSVLGAGDTGVAVDANFHWLTMLSLNNRFYLSLDCGPWLDVTASFTGLAGLGVMAAMSLRTTGASNINVQLDHLGMAAPLTVLPLSLTQKGPA
jgi:hypothetical protein